MSLKDRVKSQLDRFDFHYELHEEIEGDPDYVSLTLWRFNPTIDRLGSETNYNKEVSCEIENGKESWRMSYTLYSVQYESFEDALRESVARASDEVEFWKSCLREEL